MMTFITLLIALFIERMLWDAAPYRKHQWFGYYKDRVANFKWLGWLLDKPWSAVMLLAPPLLLVFIIQFQFFPALGGLFEMLFGLLVLLFTLGPRDLGRDTEDYLKAKSISQEERAHQVAQGFSPTCGDAEQADDQRVSQGILVDANHRLMGPIVWFLLLGAFGAVLYRLAHLLACSQRDMSLTSNLAKSSKIIFHWIDWLPARITAIGYAIAGNFDAVLAAWKTSEADQTTAQCSENDALLYAAGQAALQARFDQSEDSIEMHLSLVWRSLTVWMVLLGVVALFAAF